MRKVAVALGLLLGVFLIVGAIVEPFVIDVSDPATYRHDWGGPTLFGVLLVHCGCRRGRRVRDRLRQTKAWQG